MYKVKSKKEAEAIANYVVKAFYAYLRKRFPHLRNSPDITKEIIEIVFETKREYVRDELGQFAETESASAAHERRMKNGKTGTEWAKSLSKEELAAIDMWTGDIGCRKIKEAQISANASPEMQARINALNSAIDKGQPYSGAMHRGTKISKDEYERLLKSKGKMELWDALTSTSADAETAEKFMKMRTGEYGVMYAITKNKTGTDIAPAAGVMSAEKEIMVKKDTVYKITGVKKSKFQEYSPKAKRVIDVPFLTVTMEETDR
jgi:hypothetical protein